MEEEKGRLLVPPTDKFWNEDQIPIPKSRLVNLSLSLSPPAVLKTLGVRRESCFFNVFLKGCMIFRSHSTVLDNHETEWW